MNSCSVWPAHRVNASLPARTGERESSPQWQKKRWRQKKNVKWWQVREAAREVKGQKKGNGRKVIKRVTKKDKHHMINCCISASFHMSFVWSVAAPHHTNNVCHCSLKYSRIWLMNETRVIHVFWFSTAVIKVWSNVKGCQALLGARCATSGALTLTV